MSFMFSSLRPFLLLLPACLVLAGCASPNTSSPSAQVWADYLVSSPFSYPQDENAEMVAMLARELRSLPTTGATPEIQQHVRAVADWAALYPEYRSRADAAAGRVYESERKYDDFYGNAGLAIGGLRSGLGGTIGNVLGIWINAMRSRHAADQAWAQVMAPSATRGQLLAEAEHSINVRLGRPSTNHLRRLLNRY